MKTENVKEMGTLEKLVLIFGVYTYYFLALFLTGFVITAILSWILLSVTHSVAPAQIITMTGIIVFLILVPFDMIRIFSGKVSLALIVMALPLVFCLILGLVIKGTSKFALKSIRETFDSVLSGKRYTRFDVRGKNNALNAIVDDLYNRKHM